MMDLVPSPVRRLGSASRIRFQPLVAPIRAWLGVATAVIFVQVVSLSIAPDRRQQLTPLLDRRVQYDALVYLNIATNGYRYTHNYAVDSMQGPAFFPGLPAMIRVVGVVVSDLMSATLVLSFLTGLAAVVLFWHWTGQLGLGGAARRAALAVFMLGPWSFLLYGFPYSDSLFLAAALAAFVLVESDHLVAATLVGILASATRPAGLVVAAGLVVLSLERSGSLRIEWPGTRPRPRPRARRLALLVALAAGPIVIRVAAVPDRGVAALAGIATGLTVLVVERIPVRLWPARLVLVALCAVEVGHSTSALYGVWVFGSVVLADWLICAHPPLPVLRADISTARLPVASIVVGATVITAVSGAARIVTVPVVLAAVSVASWRWYTRDRHAGGSPLFVGWDAGLTAGRQADALVAVSVHRPRPRALLPALSALGVVAFGVLLWRQFGDPLAFWHAQQAFGNPSNALLLPGTWTHEAFILNLDAPQWMWRPWVWDAAQAAYLLVVLSLLPRVARRFGAGYGLFCLGVAVMALTYDRDFFHTGRYLLPAFPVAAVLGAKLTDRPVLARVALGASAIGMFVMSALFIRGWYVT